MGYELQIQEICKKLPPSKQTMLVSATLPAGLVDFARVGLRDPTLIRLDTDLKISDLLTVRLSAFISMCVVHYHEERGREERGERERVCVCV